MVSFNLILNYYLGNILSQTVAALCRLLRIDLCAAQPRSAETQKTLASSVTGLVSKKSDERQ
jgi:hypothetical protein